MKNNNAFHKQFVVSRLRSNIHLTEKDAYRVAWRINPYMQIGATHIDVAEDEHRHFIEALNHCGANVSEVPFISGAYDSVFMKDNAVLIERDGERRALLAKPKMRERYMEPLLRREILENLGFKIEGQSEAHLEGGDVIVHSSLALMGHGYRTSRHAKKDLQNFLGIEVIDLELRHPYFYHLDTALNMTTVGDRKIAFAYPEALTWESWKKIEDHPDIDQVIKVSRSEARNFALNWVELNDTIVIGGNVPQMHRKLKTLGKKVVVCDLNQFQLAGGSAGCLTAPVYRLQ